jgi:adenylate cyclase
MRRRTNPGKFSSRIRRQWLLGSIASVLTALFGLLLFHFPLGDGVTRVSYDLPFVLRSDILADDVALVYLDEASHNELKQPLTAPWDRSLHAQLVERLTADGARAIVFDILFTHPSTNAAADAQFARAIQQSGRVILGGNFNQRETMPGLPARWEELPYEPFRTAAAGWGNVNFLADPDYGVRECFPNLENLSGQTNIACLPWAVARFVGAPEAKSHSPSAPARWLNYYGPPGTLPSVSYFQALPADGVAPGFFKNKVVFIGAQLSADFSGKGKDELRTPYSYWRKGFAPGVEIHATAALNLMHHNWLTRVPWLLECALILLTAALAGFGLMRLHPLAATSIALVAGLLIAIVAHALVWHKFIWFAWLIPTLEIGTALFCSIIFNSLRLYVEQRLVEESLAARLSPALVKRVLQEPGLRRPGGVKQEVSFLFSDIANFSRVTESMHPDDLVNLLNRYFDAALGCIHQTDGTVMDLVGDAIFAIWNTPIEQPDHRERACRAAMLLREQLVDFGATRDSLPLRTRVGLHTGIVCVGNIGSATRFDFAAIGENTNLASRLEGLNKLVGTEVLATRDIQRSAEDSLVWRLVGHFKFKGIGRVVEVHELVGPPASAERSRVWREKFADALRDFRARQFDSAAEKFQSVIDLRRPAGQDADKHPAAADGPSAFYLEKIEELRAHPPAYEWIGEVELREK